MTMRVRVMHVEGGKYVAWEVDQTWCIAHVCASTGDTTTMAYAITQQRMEDFLANVGRPDARRHLELELVGGQAA